MNLKIVCFRYNGVNYFFGVANMDKVRKEIVLKEIRYWKEHQLLPEQYCNFLLSLYTEGSEMEQKEYEKKFFSFKQLFLYIFMIYLVMQLPITFVVIYITELSIDLQIGIMTAFVVISLCSVYYFYKKRHFFVHVALIIGVLTLFLASVHLISVVFLKLQIALIIVILMNCVLWIGLGYMLKYKYLIISGITGMIIVLIYFLR